MKIKYFKNLFFLFLMIIIQSCSNDDCLLIETIEYDFFRVEVKDETTQNDLFFGDDAIYTEEQFQVFVNSGDSLKKYLSVSTFDETFEIYGNRINNNLSDTFYVQIPNADLDTFMVNYYQEDVECYGTIVTSNNLRLNGNTVCEGCTLETVTLLK